MCCAIHGDARMCYAACDVSYDGLDLSQVPRESVLMNDAKTPSSIVRAQKPHASAS